MDAADANHYSQNRANQDNVAHRCLLKFLVRGDTVLDVGCGTGEISRYISQQPGVRRVVGFDISQEFIRYATENNASVNTSYFVADVQDFSTLRPDWVQSFHKAVCFYVLHHVEDCEKALENIQACLQHSGELLLVFSPKKDEGITSTTKVMMGNPRWRQYIQNTLPMRHDVDSVTRLVRDCGFEVLTCERSVEKFVFETEEKVTDFVRPFTRVQHIPQEQQADYLSEWWSYFRTNLIFDATRSVSWPVPHITLHARKISNTTN
ncbi:hypothetical protein Bbelb_033090 [Branchiostoma belcheri]|nr:hypothetical protein Bbelb_033090 [Branchiostoma belcheri]